eukprot:TRINITY_DN68843_c0_g1_i1.p3 TRINITY_DN68843_c0_g1~~TRINITY_DN68843_c0_g1_i1.p3  ORF type:complete len:155 (-),score=35.47 TRINITY_DN68843_c0_g1_i1:46-510(-)
MVKGGGGYKNRGAKKNCKVGGGGGGGGGGGRGGLSAPHHACNRVGGVCRRGGVGFCHSDDEERVGGVGSAPGCGAECRGDLGGVDGGVDGGHELVDSDEESVALLRVVLLGCGGAHRRCGVVSRGELEHSVVQCARMACRSVGLEEVSVECSDE